MLTGIQGLSNPFAVRSVLLQEVLDEFGVNAVCVVYGKIDKSNYFNSL